MKLYTLILKLSSPVFLLVAFLHLIYGVEADVLLGANLSVNTLKDPVLDSQNRFYGVTFALYGVLLYLCSTDLHKYKTVLRCILWVFFAAGFARFLSIAINGIPSNLVIVLLASEIFLPPFLLIWLSKIDKKAKK